MEKRFDPFYYVPELLELEKKVLAKKPKKLRDYVVTVSSGATPKTTESELYYAEKENGIPFLRVQNLSPTGVLEFDDCKYINHATHNGMLKRSQISAGDLLVKITGVGRMAVASVAPEGFIGNINQHICVIKTGSKEISETLAAFLNSDIGEKLASRRSAGGTRPALDYSALLSIPIIEDKRILKITAKVISQKKKNEAEAEKLLASIDNYLLKELGITLPIPKTTLKDRIFKSTLSKVSGNRFDCDYYFNEEIEIQINNGTYKSVSFSSLFNSLINGYDFRDYKEFGTPYIKVANVRKGNFDFTKMQYIECDTTEISKAIQLKKGNILLTRKGTYGYSLYLEEDLDYVISSEIFYIELKHDKINSQFLEIFFNSVVGQKQFERVKIGAIMGSLSQEAVKSLRISLPPIDKQKEIADHIVGIRQQAQQLKDKTKGLLKKASEEIEEILLN
ncbi:MAG: restriction endonuclease subunit S [Bacteroidota bacterium]